MIIFELEMEEQQLLLFAAHVTAQALKARQEFYDPSLRSSERRDEYEATRDNFDLWTKLQFRMIEIIEDKDYDTEPRHQS